MHSHSQTFLILHTCRTRRNGFMCKVYVYTLCALGILSDVSFGHFLRVHFSWWMAECTLGCHENGNDNVFGCKKVDIINTHTVRKRSSTTTTTSSLSFSISDLSRTAATVVVGCVMLSSYKIVLDCLFASV